jgi:hypothetical protein
VEISNQIVRICPLPRFAVWVEKSIRVLSTELLASLSTVCRLYHLIFVFLIEPVAIKKGGRVTPSIDAHSPSKNAYVGVPLQGGSWSNMHFRLVRVFSLGRKYILILSNTLRVRITSIIFWFNLLPNYAIGLSFTSLLVPFTSWYIFFSIYFSCTGWVLILDFASCGLFAWLISHQPPVFFSHNKSATSNHPTVLLSHNKPAPAISHQPNKQAGGLVVTIKMYVEKCIMNFSLLLSYIFYIND